MAKFEYCDSCGLPYPDTSTWPRTCSCGNMVWSNPVPVICGVIPVEHDGNVGVLVARRGVASEPGHGMLALPGGYLEMETWRDGLIREVLEETGLDLSSLGKLVPHHFSSNSPEPDCALLFGRLVTPITSDMVLNECRLTPESSELGIIFGHRGLEDIVCFRSHVHAIRRYFFLCHPEKGVSCPHGYVKLL